MPKVPAWLKFPVALFALFFALLTVARWLFDEPTVSFTVPSPDGTAAIVKTYTEEPFGNIKLVEGGILGRAYPLTTISSPIEVNSDGIIVSWEGKREIALASPRGEDRVSGPSDVGGVRVRYKSYDPDLSSSPAGRFADSELREPSITFRRETRDFGIARHKDTGQRVPEIDCILDVSGLDPRNSERINAQIVGRGIGRSNDADVSPEYGGVDLKVIINALGSGTPVERTLTQAQLAGVFPQSNRTGAPGQDGGALVYQGYTSAEARRMILAVTGGRFELLLTQGFDHEIRRYQIVASLNDEVLRQFNACTAETHVYGVPFAVAR